MLKSAHALAINPLHLAPKWVRLWNAAGDHDLVSLVTSVTVPGSDYYYRLNEAPTEYTTAQLNTVYHVTRAQNWIVERVSDYPGIDEQIAANVNTSDTCRANYNLYFSPPAINLARASSTCSNLAYSSVLQHEYGHHVVALPYRAAGVGQPTLDYHEGMSDLLAALINEDPCFGLDYYLSDDGQGQGCVRNIESSSVTFPCDQGSHICGQALSGAFWLTKRALDLELGPSEATAVVSRLFLNSILILPQDITKSILIDVLTLDDNDGDLSNQTPHWEAIIEGFSAKGFTL